MHQAIPVYNSNETADTIKFTATGPIARIGGTWYSVNGNIKLIWDIRYPLSEKEMMEHGVE